MANTDKYVNQFIAHHVGNYPGLEKQHVSVAISVFMCGLQLFDPQHVDEHCRQIHGLSNGIASLSPLQVISLDKDTVFLCPDLKSMEDVGPEEKKMLIDAVYNMCIAKGIFVTVNNNRSSADLNRTRAQEFLREVKKAYLMNFLDVLT